MKPDEFSPLNMYGDRNVFEKRLKEGYKELAFGGGEWVGDERIVRLFVFFNPNGRVATLQTPKALTPDGHTRRGRIEAEYTAKEFEDYMKEWKIKLGNKTSLEDIVKKWEK